MCEFSELLNVIKLSDGQYDIAKLEKAYNLANTAHKGQLRKSGEPYISHPLAVAAILTDMVLDTDSLAAALLHDVVEDTQVSLETVRKEFGAETALLVDGVTKLGKIQFISREEEQAENVRKMLMAMAEDIRVIIIKLADRLHNMRTIDFLAEQKQRDKALETMEIYAPIAHRLGVHTIKEELEDISLQHLDPHAYKEIEGRLHSNKEERGAFLEDIKQKIAERLKGKYEVHLLGRVKSIYSIYRKVYTQGRGWDEVFDVYAIRILVNTDGECYNILGEIHDMFRPLPNRFKDYISMPKPNMYQSLHTTVIDNQKSMYFEVQIRTWEMNRIAEYGIAAHWKYKGGITAKHKLDEKIAWIRQILESQQDSEDSQELLGAIKSDLSSEEVFVMTPKGDVITLPNGATVIDFAYAIHSEVGNRMTGAKIDGRMVSLDTEVHTGMVVSIITTNASGHGPSRDWVNMVKASSTRSKIRAWFKKERKEENIIQGKSDLEREMRRNNIRLDGDELDKFIAKLAKSQRMNNSEEFLAAIGYGGLVLSKIMPRVKETYQREYKTTTEQELKKQLEKAANQRPKKASSGVIVEGLDDCLVKFSKCCSPVPGDDITGYITRGFGVSVHKRDCINVENSLSDLSQQERWVSCEWASSTSGETFKSTVNIYGKDRPGFLVDLTVALNNMRLPVYSLLAKELVDDSAAIQVTFGISSLDQLKNITSNILKIKGVEKVERTTL